MTKMAANTGSWISVLLLGLACIAPRAPGQSTGSAASEPQALISKYCAGCHNQNLKSGGIALAGMNLSDSAANSGTLEKVLRKVHSGEMPPAGMPHPDASATTGFTHWLEAELDRSAAAHPNPGRPIIHRLNRAEYSNAI